MQSLPSSTPVGCEPKAFKALKRFPRYSCSRLFKPPKSPSPSSNNLGTRWLFVARNDWSTALDVLLALLESREKLFTSMFSWQIVESSHFVPQGVAEAFLHCSTFRMLRPLVGPLAVDLCRPLGIKTFERFLQIFFYSLFNMSLTGSTSKVRMRWSRASHRSKSETSCKIG